MCDCIACQERREEDRAELEAKMLELSRQRSLEDPELQRLNAQVAKEISEREAQELRDYEDDQH
jgi:hypothetical protein